MATASRQPSAPLTFDLPSSLLGKIEQTRRQHGLKSASEAVRLALEHFDVAAFAPVREAQRQISVRISGAQRASLRRQARRQHTSIGEIIRAAIEQLPAKTRGRRKP